MSHDPVPGAVALVVGDAAGLGRWLPRLRTLAEGRPLRVYVTEPQLGVPVAPSGVEVVRAGASVARVVAAARAARVIATDFVTPVAADELWIDRLPSLVYETGPAPLEDAEVPGRATHVAVLRERERARCAAAERVVCRDPETAAAIAALGADTPVEIESGPIEVVEVGSRSVAGTLAAQREADEQFTREVFGRTQLPWVRSLITNVARPEAERYPLWRTVHHDNAGRRAVVAERAARLAHRPLISVVVPVYDTTRAVLAETVESVRGQLYDRWQLVLVDDGSTRAETVQLLDELTRAGDDRVEVVRRPAGGGIAVATNDGIARARGHYVAFVDHDDVLTPDALYWVARRIELDPALDVVYSDEDKLDEAGRRVEPFFKPDWSPDYLLSLNYITHLLVVRRALLDRVGGLRTGFDGAQDYDLLLRLTEHTDRIAHVPAVLYSWRKVAGSTSADINAKPAAHTASDRALDEALVRRGLDARREPGLQPTWHRVRYAIAGEPLVSVVVPTRDRGDLLRGCVERLRATVERPFELIVVDNESSDPATLDYFAELRAEPDVRVVAYPHRFNFARQMNLAAASARGELLLLLNNDARPLQPGWFDALLEHALRPEVGAVGARLFWPEQPGRRARRAQHEGVVLNAGGVALNLDAGPFAVHGDCIRNVVAVTGACLMMRSTVLDAVGGMDERLRVAYNDVDLCLRIGKRGWRIVYTPYAELTHQESSTRGSLHPEIDEEFYQSVWGAPYTFPDPFYTVNMELMQPWAPRL